MHFSSIRVVGHCLVATSLLLSLSAHPNDQSRQGLKQPQIDHLVFAADDLDAGISAVESLLGVKPIPGGRHPDHGTHNALLSLGPRVYLEVIAPDPSANVEPRSASAATPAATDSDSLFTNDRPKLATWVVHTPKIEKFATSMAPFGVGEVLSGKRETTNGMVLSWRLSDPYAMPLQGAIPFLIDWGDTPHPASFTPNGGELKSLTIVHPQAHRIQEALSVLKLTKVKVVEGTTFSLSAQIQTVEGKLVELR